MIIDKWKVVEKSLTPLQLKVVKWLAKNAPSDPHKAVQAGLLTYAGLSRWGADQTRCWVESYRREYPDPEELAEEARNRLLRMVPAAVTLVGEAITGTAKAGRVNQFSVRLAQFVIELSFERAAELRKLRTPVDGGPESEAEEELDNVLSMLG